MHSNQSAMFVVVADVMEFFGRLTQRVRFLISYEIKYETTTAKLTLNAGELEIDVNTICGSESEIKAGSSESKKSFLEKISFLIAFPFSLQRSLGCNIDDDDGST